MLRIFTALLLIFFVLNYWCRKKLPFAYADVADYSLLYTTGNSIYISKLNVVDDSLEFLLNKPPGNTTINWRNAHGQDGADSGSFAITGNKFRYKPPAGKPQVLTINGSSVNVSYVPGGGLEYEVTSADIPVEPALVHEPAYWSPTDWKRDTRIKNLAVTRFVEREGGISDEESTDEKILKIGRLVLAGMPPDSGKPSPEVAALHPLEQYQQAKQGKINLWCGNYAAIFSCFATSVNIPVRTVFTGTSKENLGLGNHVFCEAYIKETDSWAYVDLTANTVLVQRGDQYLNVIDIQRLLRFPGGTDSLKSCTVVGDSIQTVRFDSIAGTAKYYFTPNTFFTFFYRDYFRKYEKPGLLQRVANLFDTQPMYAVYSDNLPSGNYHWLARVVSNYLFLLMAFLWLIAFGYWVLQTIRKRR